MIHEIEIAAVVGCEGELSKYLRRHVQRVAPPPQVFFWIVWAAEEFVQDIARGSKPVRVKAFAVEREVSKTDGFVVGMGEARAGLEMVVARDLEDALEVAGVTGGLRSSEETVVESCVGPADVVAPFGMLDLPVSNELHGFEDVAVSQLAGEASGERTGVVGLIAGGF